MSDPNGCGPEDYGWLIPEGPDGLFNKPCIDHDNRYNDGGTEEDRIRADWTLFKDCIKALSKASLLKRWLGYLQATIYLFFTVTLGWVFYKYKAPL